MVYGQHMNDLTEICQKVWEVKELDDKKNLLRRAVETFKYKEKKQYFFDYIDSLKKCTDCDFLASNLILNKTDKVVTLLAR